MKRMAAPTLAIAALMALAIAPSGAENGLWEKVEHGFADSDGVKIHYVTIGEGPLVLFIHGFPDFWYTWRHQMEGLSDRYRCVAIDQRAYNKSDQPKGQENYNIKYLVADVAAVIRDLGEEKSVIVGHDWGGFVAWHFAMSRPEMTDKLIILNLPHPRGLMRELATNTEFKKNSAYARGFQQPDSHVGRQPQMFAGWVRDEAAREKYVEAFKRSSLEGMLDYYRQNYPKTPYMPDESELVKVQAPVLMFHGLQDTALHHHALNNTWEWLEKDLTLITVPDSGHFIQAEKPEFVTDWIKLWLGFQFGQ